MVDTRPELSLAHNRITGVTQGTTTTRQFGYDGAGNMTTDNRLGVVYTFGYFRTNQLRSVHHDGNSIAELDSAPSSGKTVVSGTR